MLRARRWLPWVLFVLIFLALELIPYLESIRMLLDSEYLAITISDTRFSVYLLFKWIVVITFFLWLGFVLGWFVEKRIKGIQTISYSNQTLLIKIGQISVYLVVGLICFDLLGLDITTLTVFSGALGIGIGFGLQKISANFISGLILLLEGSIKKDDLVELANGTIGFIRRIGARYTLIETFDHTEVLMPNEDFITSSVSNLTYSNKKGRIAIDVGVSYKSDITKARDLILESALQHQRCATAPVPVCYLREFADSSVNFLLFFWVEDVTLGKYNVKSEVMFEIWRNFKAHDIEIPYPQHDLHIVNPETIEIK